MRIFLTILLAVLLSLAAWVGGLLNAEWQRAALSGYRPVEARLLEKGVAFGWGGRYRPVVKYQYEVNGHTVLGYQMVPRPLFYMGSAVWAKDQIAELKVQEIYTAYYDPQEPTRSFLLRRIDDIPYGLLLVPAGVMCVVLGGLRRGGFFQARARATLDARSGWYVMRPSLTLRGCLGWRAAAVLGWYGWSLPVLGHYVMTSQGRVESSALFLFIVYGLLGLPWVWGFIQALGLWMSYRDATIRCTLPNPPLDHPVTFRYEQGFDGPVTIHKVSVSLRCEIRKGLWVAEKVFSTSADVSLPNFGRNLTKLGGEVHFELPGKKRRSTAMFSRWQYPRTDWLVEVEVTPLQGMVYRATYPILSEPDVPSLL
ncbi:MAG: DUF3592 domain-containing protein [Phycisphaeraceae bacterium]|nr:DUF3592 domain-containing protein [Phycisphaeraceae bacterium]